MTKKPPKPSTRARVLEAAESLRKALSTYQRRVNAAAPGLLQKAETLRKAILDQQADAAEKGPHGETFRLLNHYLRKGRKP